MTPWAWWAGHIGEDYEIAEASSRDAVIQAARREIAPSAPFQIIEARSSTDRHFDGADVIPFVRTRNHEIIPPETPA